jgi:peptidoglycan hydrolase-like protein with peptidoglycan-binding domain
MGALNPARLVGMSRIPRLFALTIAAVGLVVAPASVAVADPSAAYLGPGPHYSNNPAAVRCVQESLDLETDGQYGQDTYDQVRLMQQDRGLPADGIVGPATGDQIMHGLPSAAWRASCYPLLPTTS